MVFDGQQVYVEGDVSTTIRRVGANGGRKRHEHDQVDSAAMTLVLKDRIDLTGEEKAGRPELDKLILVGEILKPVFSESRQLSGELVPVNSRPVVSINSQVTDQQDQFVSFQSAKFSSAVYFALSGDITAEGPGEIKSWRAPKSRAGLEYAQINFDGRLDGNLNSEGLTFSTRVRASHGPVGSLDQQIDPDSGLRPGEREVFIHCDELTINRWKQQGFSEPNIEMNAIGNAFAASQRFSAKGHRISYDHLKQIVVMSGLSPSFVQMKTYGERQQQDDVVEAETIKYFLKTNQFEALIRKGSIKR